LLVNTRLIKIWSSRTGALVEIFKSHERAVNDTCVVANYLISCSEDKSVKIWDTKSLSLLNTLNFGESVIRVSSYKYGTHDIIIACSETGKVFTFDLHKALNQNVDEFDTQDLITKFWFDKKIIDRHGLKKVKSGLQLTCMAIGEPGILLCGFNEGVVCIWDLKRILDLTVKEKKFLIDFDKYLIFLEFVHSSLVHLSDFNKSGSYLYTGSTDGTVLIWKVHFDVIESMRLLNAPPDKASKDYIFPIFSMTSIKESDNRVRCQVNAVIWSCYDNFIISLISSKKRKKALNGNEPNDSSPNCQKRSSSITIFDLSKNKVVNKLSEENGFNIHDECYVLESHPRNESLLLTVTNANEVIIVNFLTNQIISKFKEENYFFNNISQTIIASEGKFSNSGSQFVISTFLGSISIYTVYPKDSYEGTYMNQFFDVEFNSNPDILDQLFPKYVNMHNLPYIIQQPYDKLKLEQINNHTEILNNYNLSSRDINCRILNNTENYAKNLSERILDVEREEKIFILAAKENLTYMIQEIADVESNLDQMSIVDDESEIFEPEDVEINNEEEKDDRISMMSVDYIEKPESDEDDEGLAIYNLRSRGTRTRGVGNVVNSHNESPNSNNIVSNRAARYQTRHSRSHHEESPPEVPKQRRRLRKIRDSNNFIDSDQEEINIEVETSNSNHKDPDELAEYISKSYDTEGLCYLCKYYSQGVIGPFITENYFEFSLKQNDSKTIDNYEDFYFHSDCLIKYNDFVIVNNSKINIQKTIEEVINANKTCWRCETPFATKKCSNEDCIRYFHGYNCNSKYMIEIQDSQAYCLDCYRDKVINVEHRVNTTQTCFNAIPRDFYLSNHTSNNIYYPQVKDIVYFVIQPYEDYLRNNFASILCEIDNIFFWKGSAFEGFKYETPFLCEITDMEFCFPNENTVKLIKKLNKARQNESYKILTKLTLTITDERFTGKERIINIVFFENDQPDFLVNAEAYKAKEEVVHGLGENDLIEVTIGEGDYNANFIKV
jgi:WD40 repeat protein